MNYAVGKCEDHDNKILVYAAFSNRVLGVESKSFLKSFSAGFAGELAGQGAEMAADKLLENVPGGGLISGIAGGMVEDKIVSKVESMLAGNLEGKTDEELEKVFAEGEVLIDVPREKIENMQMKTKGMPKKRFHVTFKEKGFWIFGSKHKLTFSPNQQGNAEKVFGGL